VLIALLSPSACSEKSGPATSPTADAAGAPDVRVAEGGGSDAAATFRVGGVVSGLAAGATLLLRNNGADDLVISQNGAFSFAIPLARGSGYAVTVATHPVTPVQRCTTSNGTGLVGGADVSQIAITCVTASSCQAVKTSFPESTDGSYTLEVNGARIAVACDMSSDGGGWTLAGNFPRQTGTAGVAGWTNPAALGASYTDPTKPFKLADTDINSMRTVGFRARGSATTCLQGACTVNTTLYWGVGCLFSSSSRGVACGNAYLDAAMTIRTSSSDATACVQHWGLVSSICNATIAEIISNHQGDHVAVGTIGTTTHAYDGRADENPTLQFWVK
jgi:hypothetical protein